MPNFKQGGKGFQMKGWSAFTKKDDYNPQSQDKDAKEYNPQSQKHDSTGSAEGVSEMISNATKTGSAEGLSERLQKNKTPGKKNTKDKKNSRVKDFVKKHGKTIGMGILSTVFPGVGAARAGKAIVDQTVRNVKNTKKFVKDAKEFKQWKAEKKK